LVPSDFLFPTPYGVGCILAPLRGWFCLWFAAAETRGKQRLKAH
jgi:hypothetical protein